MVPTHLHNANYIHCGFDRQNSPAAGYCESNSCDMPAVGHCDRCSKLLCGLCSHPTTPRESGHILCDPWCLYDPARLRDYGY